MLQENWDKKSRCAERKKNEHNDIWITFPTEFGIEGALTWALHVAEGIESNSHGLTMTLQAFTVVNNKWPLQNRAAF